jgi:hypothetical protein
MKSCVATLIIAAKQFPLTLEFAYAVSKSGSTLCVRRSHDRVILCLIFEKSPADMYTFWALAATTHE